MNLMSTLRLSLSAVLAGAAVIAAVSASAQTAAGNLTTATPAATASGATVKRKPPTSATAEMVNEAIQRSEARAAKGRASGITERWGTEEPFTYNPAVRRFNTDQQ